MKTARSRRTQRRRPGAAKRRYTDLETYLAKSGTTQAELAAAVGTSQAYVSRLVAGRAIPRAKLALTIAEHCNIPLDSFQRAYLKRLQSAAA